MPTIFTTSLERTDNDVAGMNYWTGKLQAAATSTDRGQVFVDMINGLRLTGSDPNGLKAQERLNTKTNTGLNLEATNAAAATSSYNVAQSTRTAAYSAWSTTNQANTTAQANLATAQSEVYASQAQTNLTSKTTGAMSRVLSAATSAHNSAKVLQAMQRRPM